MIKGIVKYFYDLSEKHKLIRGFKYGSLSKRGGVADDAYPLCFLESPIYIGDATLTTGYIQYLTVNFDIVATPTLLENWLGIERGKADEEVLQQFCYEIALNYIAKMNRDYVNGDTLNEIASYNFTTLEHWKDDNAIGVRCTLKLNVPNPINYCDVDEHFDPDKEFNKDALLPAIETDDASGCVVFQKETLLPKIDL